MTDHRSDDRWGDPGRSGRGKALLAGLFVLLVLGGLYVGAAVYLGDRVPAQTTVGGVRVGGLTEAEARQALEKGVADRAGQELTVTAAGTKATLTPQDAGLSVDYGASLAGLTGFSLDPRTLWGHVSGGLERPLATEVDEDALAGAVDGAAKTFDRQPVEGAVRVVDGEIVTKKSDQGRAIDRDELVEQIADGWPGTRTYAARTQTLQPTLQQAEIDRFLEEDLEPLGSGPVTVRTRDPLADGDEDVSFSVPASALLEAVTVTTKDGRLSRTIDPATITSAVVAAGDEAGVLRPARDAVVVQSGGGFSVTPSKTGLGLDKDSIAERVIAAMDKTGSQRTATVESAATKPEVTTAMARKTLPEEQISTFTTYMTGGGPRVANIKTAAQVLNGTYVPRGETFSLNGLLGERTAAKGYQEAGVIINGRLREDYGGGISQLSTTLFNAVFFSGAKIEEFHPHSFYISRYPEGREATISWPDVDNRFTNDTDGGILIRASATDSEVTVSFYGRKTYDVEAVKGPRRNVVQPTTIQDSGDDCVPQTPNVGFDVTVTRVMKPVDGGETQQSSFDTHYIPSDSVTCTG